MTNETLEARLEFWVILWLKKSATKTKFVVSLLIKSMQLSNWRTLTLTRACWWYYEFPPKMTKEMAESALMDKSVQDSPWKGGHQGTTTAIRCHGHRWQPIPKADRAVNSLKPNLRAAAIINQKVNSKECSMLATGMQKRRVMRYAQVLLVWNKNILVVVSLLGRQRRCL